MGSEIDYFRVDAIRLTQKRRFAKPGDIFRLSPAKGVILWGRVVKQGEFFGHGGKMSLVYIYDKISRDRPPDSDLRPHRLIIGPTVVNNLGWVRGYWEIVASEALRPGDLLDRHLFKSPRGRPPDVRRLGWEVRDETGAVVPAEDVDLESLSLAGYANFNFIDHVVHGILVKRGVVAAR